MFCILVCVGKGYVKRHFQQNKQTLYNQSSLTNRANQIFALFVLDSSSDTSRFIVSFESPMTSVTSSKTVVHISSYDVFKGSKVKLSTRPVLRLEHPVRNTNSIA